MLIVYGAVAGVSVVQLYAGAFLPGIMLASLYIGYVMLLAKWKPHLAPPLAEDQRRVAIPEHSAKIAAAVSNHVLPGLFGALSSKRKLDVPKDRVYRDLGMALLPAIVFVVLMGLTWHALTKPDIVDLSDVQAMGAAADESRAMGIQQPAEAETKAETGLAEPPPEEIKPGEEPKVVAAEVPKPAPQAVVLKPQANTMTAGSDWERIPAPMSFWIVLGIGAAGLVALYLVFTFVRLEIFKMLLVSFFPLAVLILSVLGTIVFGLATPTEAAAIGSFGGFALAAVYSWAAAPGDAKRRIMKTWLPLWLVFGVSIVWFALLKFEVLESGPPIWLGWISITAIAIWCAIATYQVKLGPTVRESVFLTAKTSAMVCWLFVGSSIFSAAFALLGGQEIIERWVTSLGLTPVQFMILAQTVIFLLGWPLEWTEIIVIFMPIFIPLLPKYGIDPLFFGLLVALNLQTAFLSPPVAMAAFYLKGVSPPHVTLNAIFAGMMPFMGIQVIALILLYVFPDIGLWLPRILYR